MMTASAQVIGHRTGRMAKAGHKPSTRDQREFTLMGQEKFEAAAESVQAMAAKMMTMNPLLGPRALKQMMTGATALMSLASSRSISQSLAQQAKLARVMTPRPRLPRGFPRLPPVSPNKVSNPYIRAQQRTPNASVNDRGRGFEVRLSVELCAVYWHFLLVVWLGLLVLMLTH